MADDIKVLDEKGMRDHEVPRFDTTDQLVEYLAALTDREHDYGTSAYACSLAAVAAFNYMARKMGITGFQASCADMDVIRRTRHMDGPFMLLCGGDALYPQYDMHGKLTEFLADIAPWLKERAEKNLAEVEGAHPAVEAHWRKLAG
jgi:hypothetical protein